MTPEPGARLGREVALKLLPAELALVEGEDLAERLKRGPLPLDEATDAARHLAEAVDLLMLRASGSDRLTLVLDWPRELRKLSTAGDTR